MATATATKRRYLSTMDLLTMAAIAVVGGILSSYLWPAVMQVATPVFVFLGPVGWVAVSGVYVITTGTAGLLLAKAGATTLYGVIEGFVEMLFGNSWGAMAIVYAACQAFGVDVGMGIFKWRPTLPGVMVGAGLGMLINDEIYIFLFGLQSPYTVIVGGITGFVSGAIIGGGVSWLIVQALYKTGVVSKIGLKGYEEIK